MGERLDGARWLLLTAALAFAAGWAAAAWTDSDARAQAPIRDGSWSYECEPVASSERPVSRDDHPIARALRARDDAGWELVSASAAGPASTLFCFRRPR